MVRIFAVVLAAVLLCGCNKTQKGDTTVQTDEITIQATEAVNVISNETLVDLIRMNLARNMSADRAQYLSKLEELAEITVTDYWEDGDSITATVTVVAPNMYAIAKDIENEVFTDATSMDETVCARLEACEDFVTNTCTLTFRYVEEDWVADLSEEFSDALYGGLMTYRNEYLMAQEVQ